MSFGRQVKALMRKNCILKRRQKCGTLGEFLTPFLFCLILCLLASSGAFRDLSSEPQIRNFLIILVQVQVILIFITGCRFVLSQPVVDKETKMRETLRILSMKTSAYGLSFFFTQAIFAVITSVLISITFLILGFFSN